MNGIFAVYKPKNMTSHDVVNRVRKITGVKRVGHGGTLDPLAEGVLVIAVGRENTKLLDTFVKGEKEYMAEIKLGFTSATDDSEGPVMPFSPTSLISPTPLTIKKILREFTGEIMQTPPQYSAIKVNGATAYKNARRGKVTILEARKVNIKKIDVIEYKFPHLKIHVTCGPGVYIRSLARDIGEKLGVGGYLSSLVRTKVGQFTVNQSISLEELELSTKP